MTTTAVYVVRQSSGTDDSISLSEQRESVGALAHDLADEVDVLDLGVHTGFSIHMRPESADRIDNNPTVLRMLAELRRGEYDYLCAYDDSRLARDEFYWEIVRAAALGDCAVRYVDPPPDDDLTFRVQRSVEADVKKREMEKSARAIETRQENEKWQGGAPFGTHFADGDDDISPDPSEWNTLTAVLDELDAGTSYRNIRKTVDGAPSIGTISKINERGRGFYADIGDL